MDSAHLVRRSWDELVTCYLTFPFGSLQGDNVPAPITSFEAGGFPPEILKEV